MNVKLLFNKTMLKISEKSPEILLAVGLTGVIAGTVLAVKATKKTKDIDNELKEDLDALEKKKQEELDNLLANNINTKKVIEDGKEYTKTTELVSIKDNLSEEDMSLVEFTKEDYNKMRNKIVFNATKKYIILYSKPIILEIASIICILSAFRILSKRYAALAIAYTQLDDSFRKYRKKVQDKIGLEQENELYYGYKKELEKFKDKNGNEKSKEIIKYDPNGLSQYSVIFDESNSEWSEDPQYNQAMLFQILKGLQKKFDNQGHLFLNDFRKAYGFKETSQGQLIGWKKGNPHNDGFIDIGLLNPINKDAMNGINNVWVLDPNVDGLIINDI